MKRGYDAATCTWDVPIASNTTALKFSIVRTRVTTTCRGLLDGRSRLFWSEPGLFRRTDLDILKRGVQTPWVAVEPPKDAGEWVLVEIKCPDWTHLLGYPTVPFQLNSGIIYIYIYLYIYIYIYIYTYIYILTLLDIVHVVWMLSLYIYVHICASKYVHAYTYLMSTVHKFQLCWPIRGLQASPRVPDLAPHRAHCLGSLCCYRWWFRPRFLFLNHQPGQYRIAIDRDCGLIRTKECGSNKTKIHRSSM